MIDNLLECPYCGCASYRFDDWGGQGKRGIACTSVNCQNQSPLFTSDEAATEWWNRRVPPPPAPNWSKAPAWANYWAIDGNGQANWYRAEPWLEGDMWWSDDDNEPNVHDMTHIDWRLTKQGRPQAEEE